MNVQRACRDAAIALLARGVPLAGGRVRAGRAASSDAADQPQIFVYAWRVAERNLATAGGAPDFEATLALAVHCRASAEDDSTCEDLLFDFAEQARSALLQGTDSADPAFHAAPILDAVVDADGNAILDAVTDLECETAVRNDGEGATGEAAITIRLRWRRAAGTEPVDVASELRASIDLAPPDGRPEATIRVPLA